MSVIEDSYCPLRCGEEKPESAHFFHQGPCSWHDESCENPVWCPCSFRETVTPMGPPLRQAHYHFVEALAIGVESSHREGTASTQTVAKDYLSRPNWKQNC